MPEEKLYRVALREALGEEMERDDSVYLIGEDIGKFGGAYRVTDGLLDKYGAERLQTNYDLLAERVRDFEEAITRAGPNNREPWLAGVHVELGTGHISIT